MINPHTILYDALFFTALAYYTIGSILIIFATKIYATHPINRVFLLGEYFSPKGVALLLRLWPLVSLFGLFIFSCAVEHHLHWLFSRGHSEIEGFLLFMGWVEAGISLITAAIVIFLVARAGVRKWRST